MASITALDVRERRGTYKVVTGSGAVYIISSNKKASALVTVSGGSNRLEERSVILEGGIIELGQGIQFTQHGKSLPLTSPVVSICPVEQ